MAYSDVKTIASDLRISNKDIGSILSVDNNCNPIWINSRVTATGGVWEYNIVDKDSHIVLPPAKINVGLCVAIMRNVKRQTLDNTTDTGTAGADLNAANAKVIILPHNYGTADAPEYDNIMGSATFYCSSGVEWSTTEEPNQFIVYNTDDIDDRFSSIIFKSVKLSNGSYSWIVINGVGIWNAYKLTEHTTAYELAKARFEEFKVSLQTSSVNSLSAGVNLTDTDFVPIECIGGNNGVLVKKSEDVSIELKPINSAKNQFDRYLNGNSFVIGRFTDDFNGTYGPSYNEFTDTSVNLIGPKIASKWPSSINVNDINSYTNFLGYVFDENISQTNWYYANRNKSFSKRLGIRNKGSITNGNNNVGVAQVVTNINLKNILLKNGSTLSTPRTIYCMLQSFFEVSGDQYQPYTNIFKVRGDVYSADTEAINDCDIITLSSAGTSESNTDCGFGSIVQIPITETDINIGSINLVFEFLYKGRSRPTADTEETFKLLNNASNQYCLINFIGIEQLKPISVSPEVDFSTLAVNALKLNGNELDATTVPTIRVENAYIDKNTSSNTNNCNMVMDNGFFDCISYNETIGSNTVSKPFFDEYGKWHPGKNVTKTVLDVDLGFLSGIAAGTDARSLKYQLVIDWSNGRWSISGYLKTQWHLSEYSIVGAGDITDTVYDIAAYDGTQKRFNLLGALSIQSDGIYRLPWYINLANAQPDTPTKFDAIVNISNYKTVVNESGVVETLINYTCGWERAENEWTVNAINDGSEFDALISNYSVLGEGRTDALSPSKARISPSHAMQISSPSELVFSISGALDNPDRPKRSLLPYIATTSSAVPVRYFSVNRSLPFHNGSGRGSLINNSAAGTMPQLVANDFCELNVQPSSTGTLFGSIDLPIDTEGTNIGYLVLKQVNDSDLVDSDGFGDYEIVKDSGTSINSNDSATTGFKIEFTDKVKQLKNYRYSVILYNGPWLSTSPLSSTELRSYKPVNSIIGRYRIENGSKQPLGITDFKTLFDSDSYGQYQGPVAVQTALSQVFNRSNNTPDQVNDTTNLDLNKLYNTLYANSALKTKSSNRGSSFKFHVYVIKEAFV